MNLQMALLVGAAGFLGTVVRYLTSVTVASQIPLAGVGTFTVNLVGSFLIGLAYALALSKLSSEALTVITAGFLGGFTTYSAFSMETVLFLREGRVVYAAGYILVMVLACLAATYFGILLGQVANR